MNLTQADENPYLQQLLLLRTHLGRDEAPPVNDAIVNLAMNLLVKAAGHLLDDTNSLLLKGAFDASLFGNDSQHTTDEQWKSVLLPIALRSTMHQLGTEIFAGPPEKKLAPINEKLAELIATDPAVMLMQPIVEGTTLTAQSAAVHFTQIVSDFLQASLSLDAATAEITTATAKRYDMAGLFQDEHLRSAASLLANEIGMDQKGIAKLLTAHIQRIKENGSGQA